MLILDNIRSVHNVGSIFRTAEAVGISKIYLCGVTPTPVDRFGRERSDLAKVALGAEKVVPWEHYGAAVECIEQLKKGGYTVIAFEQDERSVDYKGLNTIYRTKSLAFVFGSETEGLSKQVLKQCDVIAEIPMTGKKESLNVSVAVGVSLFRVLEV